MLSLVLTGTACAGVAAPEEYVNTRYGTAGSSYMSYGNLVPMVAAPWGFNGWSVQTSTKTSDGWWWDPEATSMYGIRCTHRPSPWINDYGYFGVLPLTDEAGYDAEWPSVKYDPAADTTEWRPYLFAADTAYGKVEVASTEHASVIRATYGSIAAGQRPVLRVQMSLAKDAIAYTGGQITGHTNTGNAGEHNDFTLYIAGTVANASAVVDSKVVSTSVGSALLLVFAPGTTAVEVSLATSFISAEQVGTNLKEAAAGLEEVRDSSKKSWSTLLARYQINDPAATRDQLAIVYTSMYHAMSFPRFLSEKDASGAEKHFSTYKGSGVFDGPAVSDSGFWDAYRTVYSFVQMAAPEVLGRLVDGWVNAYKEGGWLPKWASPGYRSGMVGTMGDIVLADAIVNDVPGFDVEAAYAAITRDADVNPNPGDSKEGRTSLPNYLKLGYVPHGEREDVSVSLNYMMADWAVGNAAKKLGKAGADEYHLRAQNYTKLFKDGFFQSKDVTGQWAGGFDEFAWGGSYTESGPWQYRFYTPWDPKGLKQLYKDNGLDACNLLLKAQNMPGTYHVGGYGSVIHEMREMAENCWGQYAHNNQPAHHMQYMFIAMSDSVNDTCARNGQHYLRRAMQTLYKADPKMYAGDEDNGEMSAWFLLSAMGLYNLQPSSGDLFLGIPMFTDMTLALPGGKSLRVTTNGGDASDKSFVESVAFNGQAVSGVTIPYKTLLQGGELVFTLGL